MEQAEITKIFLKLQESFCFVMLMHFLLDFLKLFNSLLLLLFQKSNQLLLPVNILM